MADCSNIIEHATRRIEDIMDDDMDMDIEEEESSPVVDEEDKDDQHGSRSGSAKSTLSQAASRPATATRCATEMVARYDDTHLMMLRKMMEMRGKYDIDQACKYQKQSLKTWYWLNKTSQCNIK